MTLVRRIRSSRLLLTSAVLAASLVTASASAYRAEAAYTVCRSDPLVTLSNGDQVTMYEDISDTAADVRGISYQLHIPVGTTVNSITYSGAISSSLQTITTTADDKPGHYDAYTVVSTGTPKIAVTAHMQANSAKSVLVNGSSGQTLQSHVKT